MGDTVLSSLEEGVLTVTLNRPEVYNAFNTQMLTDLGQTLRQAERDDRVRVLVITGAGRAFCSGQDLKNLDELAPNGQTPHFGEWIRRNYNPLIIRLRALEKPVLAAVNGVAAGAGMSLALACDLRIASEQASFSQAFAKIGLVPDSGSLYFLPRLVGYSKALELCWTGDSISAQEALRLGLVNQVVPADELMAATRQLAIRLAQGPAKAIGLIKRGMNRSLVADLESVLEYESYLQEIAGRTQDFQEGVAAFVEKRPAKFKGF